MQDGGTLYTISVKTGKQDLERGGRGEPWLNLHLLKRKKQPRYQTSESLPAAGLERSSLRGDGRSSSLQARQSVLLFSIYCLSHGITTVFMHLYYFPIVLLAYRYRYRGIVPATLLAVAYVGLVYFYDLGQADVIDGAWYRVIVFVGIAAVIAYLSEQLASAQKATEEAAEVKERYISLAPAIVLALDSRGAITLLNEQGCIILGYRLEEVIGKSWFDLFIPEKDRDRIREIFRQLMTGQVEPNRFVDNPVLTRSGAEKIIRWHNTALHDENGAISGTLGFGEDVTERIRAEEKIRKLQQFQESVITNANVWITVLDARGNILLWNDAAEAISGYPQSDVLGTRYSLETSLSRQEVPGKSNGRYPADH